MSKVGYQGIYGSYSSRAALDYFGENNNFIGFDDFQAVVNALLAEEIDFGVFPVENSTTGQIYRTLDLLKYERDLFAIGETIVDVNHNLITFPNVDISQIKYVYSHPEALSQCQIFFKEHPHITPVSYEDTAKSVVHVKELGSPENAALASSLAGKTQNMNILQSCVQDMSENMTRFLIFKKVKDEYDIDYVSEKKDKMTCYFETKHKPGELSKVLEFFSKEGYNLLSIHSRSTKKNSFEYGFFLDASCKDLSVYSIFEMSKNLEKNLTYLNLMGVYSEFKK